MNRRTFLAVPLAAGVASATLYNRLHSALEKVETIDTHEHFPAEAIRVKQRIDFFTLVGHYTINDLVSAGLSTEDAAMLRDANAAPSKKWTAFEPCWKQARNTGYGQALIIGLRDIYGIQEISARTLPKIDEAIASRNRSGYYREILRNRCRIRYAVNDAVVEPADAELLRPSRRFDHIIAPSDMKLVEKLTKTSVSNLADLKRALDGHFEQATHQPMVAIKCALAYQRDIRFEDVGEVDAARDFDRFLTGKDKQVGRATVDHMVHHLMRLADQYRVTVQFHTGLLSSNGSELERTRPTQLINLFRKYPRVRFDLFHNGYPYVNEFNVLVKQFPNVYGDFCWTHIVSPSAARQAMSDLLDAAPGNKILGFGGDYRYPELSYGHLVIARRNIASVLAARVENGSSTEEQAAELGRWMLHDNPARLFGRSVA